MAKKERLVVQRSHVESGSVVGRVERHGRLRGFNFSWGTHECSWGNTVLPGDYEGWITEVVEEVFELVDGQLRSHELSDESPVRATLERENGIWVIKSLELFLELDAIDLSSSEIEQELDLPDGFLGEFTLPGCLSEAVIDGPVPIRLERL